jgi:uncharacterized membrane-anchored protein
LVFDKLRWKRADSNYVIETVMTLKAGRIVGISRALAPGSRYQVDLPEAAGSVSVQKGKFSVSADSKVEVAHGLVEVAFKGTKRTVEEGFAFDPASQATRVLTAREQRELQECFGLVIPRCPPPEHRPPWPLLRSIPRGF